MNVPGADEAADGVPIPAVPLEADVEELALDLRPVAGVLSAPSLRPRHVGCT